MAVGAGPRPVSLTQPAVPAGWVIAPVVVLRLRRATASLRRGDVDALPVGADRHPGALSSPWPSAQGPAPVSLTQPAVPAGWVIAPVVVLRLRRATASLPVEAT